MESNTQLIAHQSAMADPWKKTKIENLALLLKAAIEAQGRVGLMLNAKRADLDKLLALLPALQRPTVSSLSDPDWIAINTILEERTARDLIPRLNGGGQGYRRYPLNRSWSDAHRCFDQPCCGCAVTLSNADPRIARPSARRRRSSSAFARGGDAALKRYARDFDDLTGSIEVPKRAWETEARTLDRAVRAAIARAARHIRSVSRRQVPRGWRHTVAAGVSVEQRVVPLSRVGCYVPAGRYPLPSSLLMTAIPARAAGVREVVVCCPRPDAAVFAAAIEAGVDRLFRVGGAHAIAAMAYGTRTVARVDKIVGPGNRWVSAAKSLISADCGIDFYAGPTEILIVTSSGSASWIAADLLAQAEHVPMRAR